MGNLVSSHTICLAIVQRSWEARLLQIQSTISLVSSSTNSEVGDDVTKSEDRESQLVGLWTFANKPYAGETSGDGL